MSGAFNAVLGLCAIAIVAGLCAVACAYQAVARAWWDSRRGR